MFTGSELFQTLCNGGRDRIAARLTLGVGLAVSVMGDV